MVLSAINSQPSTFVLMNSIFQFLYKQLHWIVFIALEIICCVLLFSYNNYQGSVYLSTANGAVARLNAGKDKYYTKVEPCKWMNKLNRWPQMNKLEICGQSQIFNFFKKDFLCCVKDLQTSWPQSSLRYVMNVKDDFKVFSKINLFKSKRTHLPV